MTVNIGRIFRSIENIIRNVLYSKPNLWNIHFVFDNIGIIIIIEVSIKVQNEYKK